MTDTHPSGTPAAAPTVIESFPYAGLPTAGTAGRLARVTDRPAPLWLDDGTRWSALVGNVVNVLSFGPIASTEAEADATTATINKALAAAAQIGATVYLPAGAYTISGPLLFHSGQTILGDGKGSTVIAVSTQAAHPVTVFRSASFAQVTRDVLIRDLMINGAELIVDGKSTWQPGSMGIDFTGVSLSRIDRISMRLHDTAIMGHNGSGGYYNAVVDCEIGNCRRGLSLINDGDQWTVLDGHFLSNICGIYVEHSVGNRFRSTFSSNGVGIELGSGAQVNTVMSGSWFEGNGDASKWVDHPVQPPILGAVVCHTGSAGNTVEAGEYSGSGDFVVDETDGDNVCTSPHLAAFPAMPSGTASGRNMLYNGDFAADSDNDNIADGWTPNVPAPDKTFFIERRPDKVPPGTRAAQGWTMNPGRNELLRLSRHVEVIPGQWYTFTARTMVDADDPNPLNKLTGLYTVLIITDQNKTIYNQHLPMHDYTTGLHRHSFQVPPDATSLQLILHNNDNHPPGGQPGCYVSQDAQTPAHAWFGKFQLEPGRGISTESRDNGLMGEVRTGNDTPLPITAAPSPAKAVTMTVTHAYHAVAGSPLPVTNILPPDGFSGMVVLRAIAAFSTVTTGTGPGKIGNAFTLAPGKLAIGWYDGGSDTWWFTISA